MYGEVRPARSDPQVRARPMLAHRPCRPPKPESEVRRASGTFTLHASSAIATLNRQGACDCLPCPLMGERHDAHS